MLRYLLPIILISAALFVVSCSTGNGSAVEPSIGDEIMAADITGRTTCIGLWHIVIDESGGADVAAMRSPNFILNALQFLEPPAMSKLKVDFKTLVIDAENQRLEADVTLTHPLPLPRYRGFDVRGVVFGPKLANADGLTIIPSPEFFTGVTFGYKDGMLGAPDSFANYEGWEGYKYYCDGLGPNDDLWQFMSSPQNLQNRGTFSPGSSLTRHYILEWAEVPYPFLVFNYAVYANYANPIGPPPFTISSFPSTANSAEAFCCSVTEYSNSLKYNPGTGTGSGNVSFNVEIWDWQGNISSTIVESVEPGVIVPTPPDYYHPGEIPGTHMYSFIDVPGYPTSSTDLEIIFTTTDMRTFGESWYGGLLPSSNPLYDVPIFNIFPWVTKVALEG